MGDEEGELRGQRGVGPSERTWEESIPLGQELHVPPQIVKDGESLLPNVLFSTGATKSKSK